MKKAKLILLTTVIGLSMAACAYHHGHAASTSGRVVHHSSHGKLGKLGK